MARRRLIVATLALLPTASAFAQQPPAAAPTTSTRCGGVLCDLYYSNKPAPAPGQPDIPDPTHLPCRDFLCAAFGGRTPEPPPPAVQQALPEAAATPVKTAKHKRKTRRTVPSAEMSESNALKGEAVK